MQVIYMSGYDDRQDATASKLAAQFLQKPFGVELLLRALHRALDGS